MGKKAWHFHICIEKIHLHVNHYKKLLLSITGNLHWLYYVILVILAAKLIGILNKVFSSY